MSSLPTISIPPVSGIETLDLFNKTLYMHMLSAIADEATEVRIESWKEHLGLGKVWMKWAGNEFEMVPMVNEKLTDVAKAVERKLVSFLNPIRRLVRWLKKRPEDILYRIDINGKFTQMRVSFRPDTVMLHFIDPEKASEEAARIMQELCDSDAGKQGE